MILPSYSPQKRYALPLTRCAHFYRGGIINRRESRELRAPWQNHAIRLRAAICSPAATSEYFTDIMYVYLLMCFEATHDLICILSSDVLHFGGSLEKYSG
jgi:hypothetical protein